MILTNGYFFEAPQGFTVYDVSLEFRMSGKARSLVGRPRRYIAPERIRELRSQGLSFRAIARNTGFGYGTVRRAYSTFGTLSDIDGFHGLTTEEDLVYGRVPTAKDGPT
jgi:hypothetical protein